MSVVYAVTEDVGNIPQERQSQGTFSLNPLLLIIVMHLTRRATMSYIRLTDVTRVRAFEVSEPYR